MEPEKQNEKNDVQKLVEKFSLLEKRIVRIERALHIESDTIITNNQISNRTDRQDIDNNEVVEGKIGEFGLAWLGSIILIFGIIFLAQYLSIMGHSLASSIFGNFAAIAVFILGISIRKNYQNLSNLFKYAGYLLLYYFILQLHYYNAKPLIANSNIIVIVLVLLSGYLTYNYHKTHKKVIFIISQLLFLFTAILSNSALIHSLIVLFVSVFSIYEFRRKEDFKFLVYFHFLIYFVMLHWVLGNPIASGTISFQESPQYVLAILFLIGGINSTILLPNKRLTSINNEHYLGTVLLNAFLFTIVLGFYVVALFKSHYIWIFLSLFACCITFSAWLKIKTKWQFIPSVYALYSFMAFSIAVYSYFNYSWAIFLLALESLLVVSVSLWFRAKLIVILNLVLFILILLASFVGNQVANMVYFIFPIIALLSARIINWQKNRLEIKTEIIRNIYLFVLFFMMLFSFYKNIPNQFVTLSWTIIAIAFFVVSIVLKNVKYRYLSIGSLIATVLYLFIIDLSRIDFTYRIAIFFLLAIILLVVSLYYTKRRQKKDPA